MKKLAIILFIGLFIRLISFVWLVNLPQNGDLLRYADWGRITFLKGFDQTYNKKAISFGGDANNQPPGSLYPIAASYFGHLKAAIVFDKFQNSSPAQTNTTNLAILYFFMRIPSLIAEIILTILVYWFIKKQKGQYALLSAALLYLNPVLIYNSTFWGQMDAINNLFFVAAVMLLFSNKIISSVALFTLSCMTKLSVLPLAPLYIAQFFNKRPTAKNLLLCVAVAIAIVIVLTLPISKQPVQWLIQFVTNAAGGELQNITSEAFNFWYAIFSFPLSSMKIPLEKDLFLGIPLAVYGYFLYLLFAAPLIIKIFKSKKESAEKTFLFFALLALISFLFLPKMHERYLYPFFPLFAVALGFSKKWLWFFVSISIIHFLNLFISWDPGYVRLIPYTLLESDGFKWGLSVALLVVFLILYKIILIPNKVKRV